MRRLSTGLLAVLLTGTLAAGALATAGPAAGDEWDPNGAATRAGYKASVRVQLSGDAAPGGGGTMTLRIRPACWWSPASGPYTDAKAMLKWYDAITGGSPTRGMIDEYGPRSIWQDAAKLEAKGGDVSWYRAYCRDPADYATFAPGGSDVSDPAPGSVNTFVVFHYRAFGVGEPIPPPLVEPADLAAAARQVMVIPVPRVDRNPKIASAGAPTLVGLPTWFWVPNPAAVGGNSGTRTIRAQVGAVWAQVVASTGGLQLSSPAGGTTCPPSRATTAYAPGVPASQACTVQFTRASVAYPDGYPVTATTGWRADWTGSGGTGGTLAPLTRTATVQVPVAEVQNVVTR
jgi:hypothetical protein